MFPQNVIEIYHYSEYVLRFKNEQERKYKSLNGFLKKSVVKATKTIINALETLDMFSFASLQHQ